jgi:flagellar assembly factor FliW
MANQEVKIIESRLGKREIRMDKIIHFPRGIIGFENIHEFTLLQIQENAPLIVLQSIEKPLLGLLVADPFVFLPDYSLHIGDAEQKLLQAESAEELAVLVTATIPPGKPEETALNLLGPILINHRARLGLQVPQIDKEGPARVFVRSKMLEG